jgi:hypothetical protein
MQKKQRALLVPSFGLNALSKKKREIFDLTITFGTIIQLLLSAKQEFLGKTE